LKELDPEKPFNDVYEFLSSLAALSHIYWDEVDRPNTHNKGTIAHALACACAPDRVQWYFNGQRFRHWMPAEMVKLLGSGTSPNEAAHAEIGRWFPNRYGQRYITTMEIQLFINVFGKLQCHNVAMYHSTLRSMQQDFLLAATSGKWSVPLDEWLRWCAELRGHSGRISKAALPLAEKRKQLSKIANSRRKISQKRRPTKVERARYRPMKGIKRTAYTLKRVRT
jgi:hypothetical protein